MPDAGLALTRDEMRERAWRALAELADGTFEERLRQEAAARIVVTLRRVALLREAGERELPPPPPELAAIAARWDATAMTATEFAESLGPAELSALVAGAPGWAEGLGVRTAARPSRTGTA